MRFVKCGEVKQSNKGKRKYVGTLATTYYPTYANKVKGLCINNNKSQTNSHSFELSNINKS